MLRPCLKDGASQLGIELTPLQVDQFMHYLRLLQEWNCKFNLTAIKDPKEIIIKHFLDSLLLAPYVNRSGRLADVGTGAGFPGLPLKIIYPELEVHLIDSLGKRVKFLQELTTSLELNGVNPLHSRAEDTSRLLGIRETFDTSVARAVSSLRVLCEYCLPLLKLGGVFIAAKGPNIDDELNVSNNAIKVLGGQVKEIIRTSLPLSGDSRTLVLIEKIKETPIEYPRNAGLPERKPL